MFWIELAIYIVIIASLLYFSQYFLWLIFALFTYRFWTLLLPFDTFSKVIPFENTTHYTIAILVLSAILYFGVMLCTQSLPFLRYVFLLVMALYTLRVYSISDVMFFKDYLEAKGMWSVGYWVSAVKSLFVFTDNPEGLWGVFHAIGEKVMGVFQSFSQYIKGL